MTTKPLKPSFGEPGSDRTLAAMAVLMGRNRGLRDEIRAILEKSRQGGKG